ncbi:hypothetical protein O6H91_06G123300 [Diphasiastrum complanatum]|uniref:Uncharacterized protein n=1 Tax=Diphasiastrum complanatum TaxID=34168 RepID=A0ACC2DIN1_DIPCM|nr:hypothetical protein O6H91_06G123300 [Diphasiastrum complanatum]
MRFSSLVNGSSLSLLHIQPSVSSVPFQGTCKAWDTGTSEPTSVLDLGSPSPSSRAVSSISGSLDDRPTVSSSSLYDDSERKADGGGYLGQEQGQHSRMSFTCMDGSMLEGEVGESNFKEEAVESWHRRSNTGDWHTKQYQRSNCTAHEQISYGGSGIPPFLRTEGRNFFGNNEKANVERAPSVCFVARSSSPSIFPPGKQWETTCVGSTLEENRHGFQVGNFPRAIPTATRNILEDQTGEGYNFSGGEGSGSAAIPSEQGCNTTSEILYGFSNRGEKNGQWRCEENRNRGLDELLIDLQGYSELPVHEDPAGALQCGMENVDSMICKSPAAAPPDQSLMRWLLEENDQVETMKAESLIGVGFDESLVPKLHVQFQDRTPESPCPLLSPPQATTRALFANPSHISDNLKAACSLQSAFSMLESTRTSFPALAQAPWIQKFTEPSPSNSCRESSSSAHPSVTFLSHENTLSLPSVNSSHHMNVQTRGGFPSIYNNNQDAASKILRSQVKTMSHSGIPALLSHNQLLSSSPTVCLNLSEPSLAQGIFISQNTLAAGSSDQLTYSATSNLGKQHSFQHSKVPSIAGSQHPLGFYQQINENMLQQAGSDQSESQAYYQITGQKNQHQAAYPSFGMERPFHKHLGTNPDREATWQTKLQMGLMKDETLLGFKHFDLQRGASDQSSIGFASSDKHELQLRSIAQETSENANEGLILVNQLFRLVEALDTGDPDVARSILARLNQYPLPQHKYIQRVIFYFREALAARLVSVPQTSCQILSPLEFLQKVTAHTKFCEASPFLSFAHFMANQAILEALEGEESIHVIDFGISFGGQWASFLQDFALKPGNPRRLRITAVGFQQDEMHFAGERLCNFAKAHNILLDFQIVVAKPENLTSAMLSVRDKEPVAVNFVLGLHKMLGDSPTSIATIFNIVKGLSPRVVTLVENELDDNSPYLQRRFLETLNYYSSLSDLLGAGNLDNEAIMFIEKVLFMPEIMDIIVRERFARVEQYKGFQRWRHHFLSAGFYNIPLSNLAEMNAEYLIRGSSASQGYEILKNEGSILLGWHGKALLAASAWTC